MRSANGSSAGSAGASHRAEEGAALWELDRCWVLWLILRDSINSKPSRGGQHVVLPGNLQDCCGRSP